MNACGNSLAIAVEGLCFAGKTTLSRLLAGRLRGGLIPEYADLAPLPPFPPPGLPAVHAALSHFMTVETSRSRLARELTSPVIICDRCPLTLIAHEHAMASIGQPADPRAASQRFSQAAAAGTIIMPAAYIHLTIPDQVFADRMARRGELPGYLVSPHVRAAISAVYSTYFRAADPDLVLRLDGSASPGELTDRAEAFISGLRHRSRRPAPDWEMLESPAAIATAPTAASPDRQRPLCPLRHRRQGDGHAAATV